MHPAPREPRPTGHSTGPRLPDGRGRQATALTKHRSNATVRAVYRASHPVPTDDAAGVRRMIQKRSTKPVSEELALPFEQRAITTVMFTDIVESTVQAASLGDRRWTELLDSHDRLTREQLRHFGGEEITTTGDGFLATFDGPARAIGCALATIRAAREAGVNLRAGLHTGACERRGRNIQGIAVHTGARVAALAAAGEVLVSRTIKDLVAGSGIGFEERGVHTLKGVPDQWQLFAVSGLT